MVRWLVRSFLPDKFPEADIPLVTDISEVQRMLAVNVVQWKDKWVEQGMAQGLEQGLEKGLVQGLEQGERKLFRRSIELRFGGIPTDIGAKIDSATTEQIEQWMERLFSAEDINGVFR